MPNRLANETSPYLLLHKDNPVDWYPWGEEALAKACEEDKPIFLSVGYSTCYWCHVMERESFADPAVAELMNRELVNIKVDREERPDLDEIYMAATQLLTHQGGWPNSVFLTPELKPYYAGTYFPPEERYGRPSFSMVLNSMIHAWRERRDDVQEQVRELETVMQRFLEDRGEPSNAPPSPQVALAATESLARRFDREHAGFGAGGPKFPSPANLFLLHAIAISEESAPILDQPAAEIAGSMLSATLDRMARGGIYDQLGGGFHRYATDREWKVPHFEKMLYDNGLLLELYAHEHARTGDVEAARIVRHTAEFLDREMGAPDGGFWSAIDAETHGHEGAYYVWTLEELIAILGQEDAGFLATLYGFDGQPFFEDEAYVLHLPLPLAEQAARRRTDAEQLLTEIEPLRAKLLDARYGRERPATDDKILTDWNGMAISGLATAGRLLELPGLVERAAGAADFLLAELRDETGLLLHSWRGGEARIPAFLADYGFFVRGLLALHAATGAERWLAEAERLAAQQEERLGDPQGGWHNAAAGPDLLFRGKETVDGALPAANGVALINCLELAQRAADRAPWKEQAERALRALAGFISAQPDAARMLSLAAWNYGGPSDANPGASSPTPVRDPLATEARRVVSAQLHGASSGPSPDKVWRAFRLELELEPGWHVYASPGDVGQSQVEPTQIAAGQGSELREVLYPAPSRRIDGEIGVYEGKVEIRGELRAAGDAQETLGLVLSYQPCDASRCLPQVEAKVAFS